MTAIDPLVSLAFSIHSSPGIYALLLGSGVSRAAGIPTGWEVTLDLIRKAASLQGESADPDPAEWYKKKFGADPEYSKLLETLSKSQADRASLLRAYCEPNEQERADGLKVPTEAHRRIAQLVSKGYVKVIITTNFDRLLELALGEVGVNPVVIDSPDAAEGALPLIHSSCTVIKVHGDYHDARIKNTAEELASYDKRLSRLLDRVLDEFGLLVCGWSGEWDHALRAEIERCKNQRFACYWTTRERPSDATAKLMRHRRAHEIRIKDANEFFANLSEKIEALEGMARPHPLSAKMAEETVKRLISDGTKSRIRFHDLVTEEANRLYGAMGSDEFSLGQPTPPSGLEQRLRQYEAHSEILLRVFMAAAYWGNEEHLAVLKRSTERIAGFAEARQHTGPFYTAWENLQRYPSTLLVYGAGLSAIAAQRYQPIKALIADPVVTARDTGKKTPILKHTVVEVLDPDLLKKIPEFERRRTPSSDYLFKLLRGSFQMTIPDEREYESVFDRFEYIIALLYAHHVKSSGWAPPGRFWWHNRENGRHISTEIESEIQQLGQEWPPLKAGLFGGTVENLRAAKTTVDQFVQRLPRW